MKLPDDPKERNQILVLVGILSLFALYGVYMGANILLIKPHKENEKQIAELTDKLTDADSDVKLMPEMKKLNNQHIMEIREINDAYLLHPRLGSFILPAQEFVEEQANAVNTPIIEVTEIGISEFPAPEPPKPAPGEGGHAHGEAKPVAAPKKEYAFKVYTARVTVDKGLHNMIKLTRQIENANPYICISSVSILPNEESPDTHDMTFDIQWPIWNPNKTTEKILQQLNSPAFLADLEQAGGTHEAPQKTGGEEEKKEKQKPKTPPPPSPEQAQALKDLGVPVDE